MAKFVLSQQISPHRGPSGTRDPQTPQADVDVSRKIVKLLSSLGKARGFRYIYIYINNHILGLYVYIYTYIIYIYMYSILSCSSLEDESVFNHFMVSLFGIEPKQPSKTVLLWQTILVITGVKGIQKMPILSISECDWGDGARFSSTSLKTPWMNGILS